MWTLNKRWSWSNFKKLILSASWTHCPIAQSVGASERNAVVVGSKPTQVICDNIIRISSFRYCDYLCKISILTNVNFQLSYKVSVTIMMFVCLNQSFFWIFMKKLIKLYKSYNQSYKLLINQVKVTKKTLMVEKSGTFTVNQKLGSGGFQINVPYSIVCKIYWVFTRFYWKSWFEVKV